MTSLAVGVLSHYTANYAPVQGFSHFLETVENSSCLLRKETNQDKNIIQIKSKLLDGVKGEKKEFEKITKKNKRLSEVFDVLIANSKQGQSIQVTSSFRSGYETLSEKLLSIISRLERLESIAKEIERQELLSKSSLSLAIQGVIKSAVSSYESTLAVIDYVDAFNALSEPGYAEDESTGVDWLDKLR